MGDPSDFGIRKDFGSSECQHFGWANHCRGCFHQFRVKIDANDQGWIFGTEIVLSTLNAKFHFFFTPIKRRNIILEWNYVIWSGILAKFSAKCPSLTITDLTLGYLSPMALLMALTKPSAVG